MLLSASALAFIAAPSASQRTLAQDAAASQCDVAAYDKLYEQFTANQSVKNPPEKRLIAYNAAKEIVAKYPNCADRKEQTDFIQKWIPKYEEFTADAERRKNCGQGLDNNDANKVFSACKEILAKEPDNLKLLLLMVNQGYTAVVEKKNDSYMADTINLTKQALDKVKAGKTPDKNDWSPYTDKEDAIASFNFNLAQIYFNRMQNKKDAMPYYYEALKHKSDFVTNSYVPYYAIGNYNLDLYTKAAEEFKTKAADTTVSDDQKAQLVGTWKAYADRALEGYARAYAKAKAKNKTEVANSLNETLTELYKLRNKGTTNGLDAYIASLNNKPVFDPTSPITPVIEADTTAPTATSITSKGTGDSDSASSRTTGTNSKTGTNGAAGKSGTNPQTSPAKPNGTNKPAPVKKPTKKAKRS